MHKKILILGLITVMFVSVIYGIIQLSRPRLNNNPEIKSQRTEKPNPSNNSNLGKQPTNSPTEEKVNSQNTNPTPETGTTGNYENYSPETVSTSQRKGNKVVLFFHAPWCPYCKEADIAFQARFNQIPAGVTVLKTDYDSETVLKQKYGVTYQHTFVQIDNNGNMVSKWNGGDIDNLNKYIK